MSRLQTHNTDDFWQRFNEYLLKTVSKETAKYRLSCAKKYHHVLLEENAADLLILSNEKRTHVMKSLSNLAKFLGLYDKWKMIISKYQLKWSNENGLESFNKILNVSHDYNAMLNWLKSLSNNLPEKYGNVLLYNSLVGLRPSEAIESIKIVNSNLENYLNRDLMVLEHFKFPEIFIRRTKNAYISLVSDEILKLARDCSNTSYAAIKAFTKRNCLKMNMNYCRKIFATYLRNNGIEQEIIDLLQGRIPKSIFVRHYYRPDFTIYDKVKILITQIHNDIVKSKM